MNINMWIWISHMAPLHLSLSLADQENANESYTRIIKDNDHSLTQFNNWDGRHNWTVNGGIGLISISNPKRLVSLPTTLSPTSSNTIFWKEIGQAFCRSDWTNLQSVHFKLDTWNSEASAGETVMYCPKSLKPQLYTILSLHMDLCSSCVSTETCVPVLKITFYHYKVKKKKHNLQFATLAL